MNLVPIFLKRTTFPGRGSFSPGESSLHGRPRSANLLSHSLRIGRNNPPFPADPLAHPAARSRRPGSLGASPHHEDYHMKRPLRLALVLSAVAAVGQLLSAPSKAQPPDGPDFPFPDGMRRPDPMILEYQNITKGAKAHEGLFKLYQKEDKLYAELMPQHFNKNLLVPIAVARGAGMGGSTLNFEEQWVVFFKRVGNQV